MGCVCFSTQPKRSCPGVNRAWENSPWCQYLDAPLVRSSVECSAHTDDMDRRQVWAKGAQMDEEFIANNKETQAFSGAHEETCDFAGRHSPCSYHTTDARPQSSTLKA